MQKKCILILLDGLGDRSYPELGDQTPLQAATTPVLDNLAKTGANGLYHAAAVGQALPSENAHFIMFGYDMADFPGRGALEAMGAGIDLKPDEVAILTHFVNLREKEKTLILEEDLFKLSPDDAPSLIQTLENYEKNRTNIRFHHTKGHYGVLVLQGYVSPFITDSDPIQKGYPLIAVRPWADYADDYFAQNTAEALNAYLLRAHHSLKEHPLNLLRAKQGKKELNGLVTQRAGRLNTIVTPFREKCGLNGLSISSGFVFRGLCQYIGMDHRKVTETDDPEKDMAERLAIAHEALNQGYDFIHVHTKAPDEAGHAWNPLLKKSVIESLDRGIGKGIGTMINDPNILIVITADHSTPSSAPLIHSGETVPLTFCGEGVRRDNVSHFDEVSAANGALGCIRGKEFMYLVLNHLDRCKLHGLMDTPVDQPYWHGNYEPMEYDGKT